MTHMTEFTVYKDVRTAWRHTGEGRDVILLHGWGQNMYMMGEIEKHLTQYFSVYNLDFPGHGESGEPPEPWGVPDYESFLAEFIAANGITDPILIGHSFGCRVAIRYAADHPDNVYKMVLTGAAGIRPERSAKTDLRTKAYKAGKWFLQKTGNQKALEALQNRSGSEDYRNAKGVIRPTFVKVVNDDVRPLLGSVVCPVLLVWGEFDAAVPLEMGRIMEREMKDAGLAVFEGDDHFAYWHQPERFNRVLDAFLKEDMQ